MNVLVTGGAGYIGSHAALRLLADGHAVTVIDDLSRGNRGAVEVLEAAGDMHFVEGDFGDRATVEALLRQRRIEAVMHFAALAYVGESVELPLRYYRNNLANAVSLLEAMETCGVSRLVFSSTAATYGEPPPTHIPITEGCPQQPVNPYGRTKLAVEQMLFDHLHARTSAGEPFAFAALRYFNVAGCDSEGRLGEDHVPETHLIPICIEAALGRRKALTIFGTDYDTPDGTCIRDYIHVDDLVDAHVQVMRALKAGQGLAYNLGIGKGYSVREVVDACRRVSGVDFEAVEGPRRPGDPPTLYADPSRIRSELGWSARITDLDEIVATAWRWAQAHPDGYGG
jgi:UDP-glucose 4-epimerase